MEQTEVIRDTTMELPASKVGLDTIKNEISLAVGTNNWVCSYLGSRFDKEVNELIYKYQVRCELNEEYKDGTA